MDSSPTRSGTCGLWQARRRARHSYLSTKILGGLKVRTLAVPQNITLDGSFEMLGDWFDPQGSGDVAYLLAE